MELREIMLLLLAAAGILAVLVLTYLLWRANKTLDALNKTLEEATTTIVDLRMSTTPLIAKASVTVDAINMELLRIDDIITSIESTSKKVGRTSESITGLVNAPVDAVADLAKRARQAIKGRRAELESSRKAEAQVGYISSADTASPYEVFKELQEEQ